MHNDKLYRFIISMVLKLFEGFKIFIHTAVRMDNNLTTRRFLWILN